MNKREEVGASNVVHWRGDENERVGPWLEEIEKLKEQAVRAAQAAEDKRREYQAIMQKIADCERAIREGRIKDSG